MHKIKTTIVIFELPVPKIKQHNFFFYKNYHETRVKYSI